ncbi:RNA-binding cell elongation regulator Jag/EloR [Alkalicoccus chagannorensis]|uniref:RNA-binding cell elongation regulator Jag/EloR n=1 Tax=Alkalicoccus chagannorensis TaxID=427072 RepID=UPI000405136A|nr:RNA-binding cell elongation regulator Jag/EloR [Alkalicoccus chagannorensis]
MNKVTVSGRTVDEAVQSGLQKLEAAQEEVKIQVIEEPHKGFLGLIGSKPAVVELERIPDPKKAGLTFLRDMIDKMGVRASVEVEEREEGTCFHIHGSDQDIGVLIGRRGQTLDSMQYLVNLAANRGSTEYSRFLLDAEGYRARRREALEKLAERLAHQAIRTNQAVRLEPMSAAERKVIHHALQQNSSVATRSDGKEPHRRVVVEPKK